MLVLDYLFFDLFVIISFYPPKGGFFLFMKFSIKMLFI